MPRDVLQDDDGVVHQHAHRQCDAAEAHDVQGDVEGVHEHERRQHRDRNGRCHDKRAADVLQEQVQHDHGEQGTDKRGVAHFVDGGGNELGLVVDGDQLVVAGQIPGNGIHTFVNGGGDGYRVGVALFVHGDLDGLVAVDAHDAVAFLVALGDRGDVLEAQHPALVLEHDGVGDVGDGFELVDGADQVLFAPRRQSAAGEIDVRRLQPLAQGLHADVELR